MQYILSEDEYKEMKESARLASLHKHNVEQITITCKRWKNGADAKPTDFCDGCSLEWTMGDEKLRGGRCCMKGLQKDHHQ